MMRGMVLTLLGVVCALGFSSPAQAQPPSALAIDLSQDHVDITMGFAGARFVVYGTKNQPGDIAIIVRGPDQQMMVRRKDDVGGIWMNRDSVVFDNVPAYYDVALSRPAREIASQDLLEDYDIGLDAMQFLVRDNVDETTQHNFREALIRNRQAHGYLPLEPAPILFVTNDFFRAVFDVPPDVPPGSYRVLAYLIRDGQIVGSQARELRVAQQGFSARIYSFAHDHALAYGLAAVLLAALAGWGAWAVMRRE